MTQDGAADAGVNAYPVTFAEQSLTGADTGLYYVGVTADNAARTLDLGTTFDDPNGGTDPIVLDTALLCGTAGTAQVLVLADGDLAGCTEVTSFGYYVDAANTGGNTIPAVL